MQYLKLKNGDNIPVLGFGTFKTDAETLYNTLLYSIKSGYRMINCASIYGNEDVVGNCINEILKENQIKREDLFISAKLFNEPYVYNDLEHSLNRTLVDLNLDYIDLFLIQYPVLYKTGFAMPSNEQDFVPLDKIPVSNIWKTAEKMLRREIVRNLGVVNYTIELLEDFRSISKNTLSVNQIECQDILKDKNSIDFASSKNIVTIANFQDCKNDIFEKYENNEIINKIAKKYYATATQLLCAWQMNLGCAVVPKAKTIEEFETFLEAEKIILKKEDFDEITIQLQFET